MIAIDTTGLSMLWVPGSSVCIRGALIPIKHAKERLDNLIQQVSEADGKIIIPAPALSEVLVRVPRDHVNDLINELKNSRWFKVESFDEAAAIELATRTSDHLSKKERKQVRSDANFSAAKQKFDRQIVAIAIVSGASKIISNDPDVVSIGGDWGLEVVGVEALELPPELVPPPLIAAILEDESKQEAAQTLNPLLEEAAGT